MMDCPGIVAEQCGGAGFRAYFFNKPFTPPLTG